MLARSEVQTGRRKMQRHGAVAAPRSPLELSIATQQALRERQPIRFG